MSYSVYYLKPIEFNATIAKSHIIIDFSTFSTIKHPYYSLLNGGVYSRNANYTNTMWSDRVTLAELHNYIETNADQQFDYVCSSRQTPLCIKNDMTPDGKICVPLDIVSDPSTLNKTYSKCVNKSVYKVGFI